MSLICTVPLHVYNILYICIHTYIGGETPVSGSATAGSAGGGEDGEGKEGEEVNSLGKSFRVKLLTRCQEEFAVDRVKVLNDIRNVSYLPISVCLSLSGYLSV